MDPCGPPTALQVRALDAVTFMSFDGRCATLSEQSGARGAFAPVLCAAVRALEGLRSLGGVAGAAVRAPEGLRSSGGVAGATAGRLSNLRDLRDCRRVCDLRTPPGPARSDSVAATAFR